MHRLGDFYTDLLQQELNETKEPEKKKHYHFEFDDKIKKHVNLFKLGDFLHDKCNQKVKKLNFPLN